MARPRSAAAHKSVLEAALELFAARGIDATSMDAIADASGVSKATIYKHWRDKEDLCLEALSYLHGVDEEPPVFDSGDLRKDLIRLLNFQPAPERREMKERLMPHLMAYSARNREFGIHWRTRLLDRPRAQLQEVMRRGMEDGELLPSLDLEVGVALLLGPMMYRRIILGHADKKLPVDLATPVVDAFLAAYGTRQPLRRAQQNKLQIPGIRNGAREQRAAR